MYERMCMDVYANVSLYAHICICICMHLCITMHIRVHICMFVQIGFRFCFIASQSLKVILKGKSPFDCLPLNGSKYYHLLLAHS